MMINNQDYYKWGLFCFNRQDPRVIVPKNIQWMGWTLNFAQPGAWLMLIGLVLLVVIFSIL